MARLFKAWPNPSPCQRGCCQEAWADLMKVWLVMHKINPHLWSSGSEKIMMICSSLQIAENLVEMHPDKKYISGQASPPSILEIKECELDALTYSGQFVLGAEG